MLRPSLGVVLVVSGLACSSPSDGTGTSTSPGDVPLPMGTGGTGASAGTAAPPPVPPPAAGTSATMDLPPTDPMTTAGTAAPTDPMTDLPGPTDPSGCPAAPAGADAQTIAALAAVHSYRLPAGAGCVTMVAEINTAAQNHCDYYAANSGMCIASPHNEVMGCAGFTGEDPGDRMNAAGYQGWGGGEVMAFQDDGAQAVAQWVNSVWHRLPILDPWTTELGYGHAANCDTIDFGSGSTALPDDALVLYPYDGQTDVPVSFDGSREGPMPPAPSTGWPSASPITLYAQEAVITEHVLTLEGDTTPIEHVWLTSADSSFLDTAVMMYANEPFTPQTTYRVRIAGSYVGGPLDLEWTFTTGDEPTWGFP